VVGSAAILAPAQIGATGAKVGNTFGFTMIVIVVGVAQSPAVGVKVYVLVIVLLSAGAQVPVIPFKEVVGKAVKVPPEQIGPFGVNVGIAFGVTLTVTVSVAVHPMPLFAVNVYVVVLVGQTVGVKVVALVMPVVGDQLNGGILLLKVILQSVIKPDIMAASSLTKSCQVPLVVHPFNKVKESSGKNTPVNGGVPLVMDIGAVAVKHVPE
jgi:hypothetical protein